MFGLNTGILSQKGLPPFNFNNALYFGGSTNGRVEFTKINCSGAFTVSLWWKKPNTNNRFILGDKDITTSYIEIRGNNTIRTRSPLGIIDFTIPTYSVNTWYHLAITRDSSNNVLVYHNGTLATGTSTNSGTYSWSWVGNSSVITFNEMDGTMDDVAITNGYAASSTMINKLWNSGNGNDYVSVVPLCDVYFHFDESGSDTTAIDSSGNANDGTLTNITLPGAWVSH